MLIRSTLCLATMAIPLASCGGPDSATPTPSPTQTPTPAPTPTPTPTPPSYPPFDAAVDQTFQSTTIGYDLSAFPPSLGGPSVFGAGLTLDYSAAAATYVARLSGIEQSFGPAERLLDTPGTVAYAKANGDAIAIVRPLNNDGIPSSLVHGRIIDWMTTVGSAKHRYLAAAGVPTRSDDAPSAQYWSCGGFLRGFEQVTSGSTARYEYVNSFALVTFDFVNQAVRLQMTLKRQIGQDVGDLGVVQGNGTFVPGTNRFFGHLGSSTRDIVGTFEGQFFGPRFSECGMAFNFQPRATNINALYWGVGAMAGGGGQISSF